jgi:DNA polymerase III subunit delta
MLRLFYGPDELACSEAVAALKQAIPPDLRDLNCATIEVRGFKLEQLIAACEAYPFLADARLVLAQGLLKGLRAGKARDELRAYLERVPATCDLVFVEGAEFDKRSSIFVFLKKEADKGRAELREFLPREGEELLRWLDARARLLGVRLERAAAQRLVEYVGAEGRALLSELGKLAAYVGSGGTVTAREVALLVQDAGEQSMFAFIDDLALRRRAAALRGLRGLLDDGQAPTYVLFMLARQLRVLLGVQELAQQRVRPEAIAAELGQKPFVVRKALEQARGFRAEELLRLHDLLLELDHGTKTGRIEPEVALELVVYEATRSPQG